MIVAIVECPNVSMITRGCTFCASSRLRIGVVSLAKAPSGSCETLPLPATISRTVYTSATVVLRDQASLSTSYML